MDFLRDTIAPLLGALIAGSLIGLERGSRSEPAGFRTHAAVCLTSAAVVLAARHYGAALHDVSAASRIAQGVVTGVGFVGAGVIVRQGASIYGLTTAASVWAVAALGVTFGLGFWQDGAAGAALLLAILYLLRPLDKRLPRKGVADFRVRYARGKALSEEQLRELLGQLGVTMSAIRHTQNDAVVEHSGEIHANGPAPTTKLADKLNATPGVAGFDIQPRTI
jgi:putative Mg2+ transporter-C (MgtC) family protein